MEIKNIETEKIEFEIPDDILRKIVGTKLSTFDMPDLDTLDDKTIKRLLETEFFIQKSNNSISKSLHIIKSNTLTKQNLTNSNITSYSRKTLYNDTILKEYVENCISHEPDYFNTHELKKIQTDFNNLKTLYDKLLVSIIDIQDLKLEIKALKNDIIYSNEEKENLSTLIFEKDKEIYELKKLVKSNNIRTFPNQK